MSGFGLFASGNERLFWGAKEPRGKRRGKVHSGWRPLPAAKPLLRLSCTKRIALADSKSCAGLMLLEEQQRSASQRQ